MATMNFSIPDDIKERFNRMFADRNKSSIVAQLLDEAIAREERKQQSDQAIKRILLRRLTAVPTSTAEILQLRDENRGEPDATHGIPRR
ncbi:hypothetical protein E4Q23_09840 [Candidatus Accumulibacter phosphatis]|jgi:metal-responsive CopG/Arc/MetJ family transcriptional regulator|uniref:Uncharacterized protein n=1 Tax=Candidatus Accumulibacter phosphatis TaxID=327160 RepID=A0ABX1TX25_9PROT|nr:MULTISPECIES: hypothetical protein [Candidatus Accumulibacter]NMQ28033.1 hypothetical protein [Candidatus Accumulibacter phosphatis]